mmetsp:Transcript_7248/g.14845  ORF Transcript_7248/g.14845 Transcript_7248/m.14845 type:complete len:383 (+) Transcript_7248:142-1290(+)
MPRLTDLSKPSIVSTSPASMADRGDTENPPFVLGGKRYDEANFYGRFRNILIQYDARKCLKGDATLTAAEDLLAKYKHSSSSGGSGGGSVKELGVGSTARGGATGVPAPETAEGLKWDTDELWRAQELVGARCHPDTGKRLPVLFTFAAFLPLQPPIILGLIWPGASATSQALWQTLNQFLNAGVNFSNKNQSVPMSNEQLAGATAATIATAVSLSVGVVKLGEKLKHPAVRGSAGFVGCLGSGWASLILMRKNELDHGVDVFDEDGNKRGLSKVAATEGIFKCCLARIVWNVPCTGLVPIAYSYYQASKFAAKRPALAIPVHACLITFGLTAGLIPGQALFTQTASIDAAKLEPQFQDLMRHKSGLQQQETVRTYTYNKGM